MIFGLGACGDSSAPTGGGGAGGNGEPGYGESDCGVCVLDACTEEIEACSSDPGCTSYLECLLACPVDPQGNAELDCDQACVTGDSSETLNAVSDVRICRSSEAGADCAPCGVPKLDEDSVLTQACEPKQAPRGNVCRQCFFDKCCDTWDACFDGGNPDCESLVVDCLAGCDEYPIEGCVSACFDQHPESVSTYLEQQRCALLKCASDKTGDQACDASTRDDCEVCMVEDCEASLNDLIQTEAGLLAWACLGDCSQADGGSTPSCIEACFDDHPSAVVELSAYGECISYLCTPKCVPEE